MIGNKDEKQNGDRKRTGWGPFTSDRYGFHDRFDNDTLLSVLVCAVFGAPIRQVPSPPHRAIIKILTLPPHALLMCSKSLHACHYALALGGGSIPNRPKGLYGCGVRRSCGCHRRRGRRLNGGLRMNIQRGRTCDKFGRFANKRVQFLFPVHWLGSPAQSASGEGGRSNKYIAKFQDLLKLPF